MKTQAVNSFGFKKVETNDHAFAAFLRKMKAIDDFRKNGRSNVWYEPNGASVALCIYKDAADCDYYIRADLEL